MLSRIVNIIISSSLVLLVAGCSPYPTEISEFRKVVHSWGIEGKTTSDAIKAFEEKGFSANSHKAENYFKDQRDYIFATQSKSVLIICAYEWRAIAMLGNGKVEEIKPYIFFNCIWCPNKSLKSLTSFVGRLNLHP